MTEYHVLLLAQWARFLGHGFVVARVTPWGVTDAHYLGQLRYGQSPAAQRTRP